MASCSGIGIKEIGSTKVYLTGTITGLDSSKRYCLHHFWSGWQNLPRSGTAYTYISGRTSFDLGSSGCYVPKNKTIEGQQFEVRCNEVERTCESIIREACTKILRYEITKQHNVYFRVRDENGNGIKNVKIECAGESFYTDSDGKVIRPYDAGHTYYSRCYKSSGYNCTDCNESFYLNSDEFVNFYMKKIEITPPVSDVLKISAPSNATQHEEFYVDVSGAPMSKEINIKREIWPYQDTVLGTGVAGGDGKTTIKCITEVSGTIKVYGCYNPGLTKCEKESTRSQIIVTEGATEDEIGTGIGRFVDVKYPLKVHEGDEVEIVCTIENNGDYTGEYRVCLCNENNTQIDCEPDLLWVSIPVGEKKDITVSTHYNPQWAMPAYDWNLTVNLWEVDTLNNDDLADSKSFTVEYAAEDELAEGELTIKVPSIVMAGTVKISGVGLPNERVYIMGEKSWIGFDSLATDTELINTIIGEDGKYETEIELDDFGFINIYAKIKKGGFWDWVVADIYTPKQSVLVLTPMILIILLIGIGLVIEKKYNYIGIFKRG